MGCRLSLQALILAAEILVQGPPETCMPGVSLMSDSLLAMEPAQFLEYNRILQSDKLSASLICWVV